MSQVRFVEYAPWLAIMAAIAVNIVVGHLVQNVFQPPLYLDSIGTILVGTLFGPLLGAVTGAVSKVLWGLLLGEPTIIPFAIVAAAVGLCAGFAVLHGAFKRWPWVIVPGWPSKKVSPLPRCPAMAWRSA